MCGTKERRALRDKKGWSFINGIHVSRSDIAAVPFSLHSWCKRIFWNLDIVCSIHSPWNIILWRRSRRRQERGLEEKLFSWRGIHWKIPLVRRYSIVVKLSEFWIGSPYENIWKTTSRLCVRILAEWWFETDKIWRCGEVIWQTV